MTSLSLFTPSYTPAVHGGTESVIRGGRLEGQISFLPAYFLRRGLEHTCNVFVLKKKCPQRCFGMHCSICYYLNFPGGSDGKVSAYNAGDPGSILGSGRSAGEGNGNPLQYSCLGNSMDRGAWEATLHGVAKSRTRLSDFTFSIDI